MNELLFNCLLVDLMLTADYLVFISYAIQAMNDLSFNCLLVDLKLTADYLVAKFLDVRCVILGMYGLFTGMPVFK